MKYILIAALLLITGCTGISYLGQIDGVKFYAVSKSKIDGPNFNALVTENKGTVKIENVATGPGIISSVASPAIQSGTTLGAAVLTDYNSTVNVKK